MTDTPDFIQPPANQQPDSPFKAFLKNFRKKQTQIPTRQSVDSSRIIPPSPPELPEPPIETIPTPTVEWHEIPEGQWEMAVTELLQEGEYVDYGEVVGKYLRGGQHGIRTEEATGPVGQCSSENATKADVTFVKRLLETGNAEIEGAYQVINPETNEHGMLLAAKYTEFPLYLQSGGFGEPIKRSVMYERSAKDEIIFIGITPTKIAGEMDLVLIGQDYELIPDKYSVSYKKNPRWKPDDALIPNAYGETRLLDAEQRKKISSKLPVKYEVPFFSNGIGVGGSLINEVLVDDQYHIRPEHNPQDHLAFFKPAISDLRTTNFPYKPATP